MRSKTNEFYRLNMIDVDKLNELYRYEFTIKSSKMMDHYFGTKDNTLSNFLNILKDHERVCDIAQQIHDIYTGNIKQHVEPNDFKSIPMLLRFILIQGYHLGKKFSTIESELNEYLEPMKPRTRQRVINQLKSCYLEKKDIVRYQPYQEEQIKEMLKGVFS